MSKELQEALVRAGRIIDQWEKNELESYEAMELLAPLLKTIAAHIERGDPAAESSSDPNLETPEAEEHELVEKEELQDSEPEPEDLFSKTEDHEDKDESKSKSKKRKFAGSNGEIPF